jgi:hypothetical protein
VTVAPWRREVLCRPFGACGVSLSSGIPGLTPRASICRRFAAGLRTVRLEQGRLGAQLGVDGRAGLGHVAGRTRVRAAAWADAPR